MPSFAAKIGRHRPAWVTFNGKQAVRVCARWAGRRAPGHPGGQDSCRVVMQVAPSSEVSKGTSPLIPSWVMLTVPVTSFGSQKPTKPLV